VFTYILIVAVLNLGLGFAMSLHLGQRHRRLQSPLPELFEPPMPSAVPAGERPPAAASAPVDVASAIGAEPEPAIDAHAKPPAAAPPAEPTRASDETCLADFRTEVDRYQRQLAETDDALRSYVGTADAAAIEACLSSLMEATNEYLEKRQDVHQSLEQQVAPELPEARSNLQQAVQLQDDQVRRSNVAIQGLDIQADLTEGGRRMFSETSKLLDVNHHLRDTLDEVLVEIARKESRLDAPGRGRQADPLTGLCDRAGLEAELAEWWRNDGQSQRVLSAALIDLDNFAQVNERFGEKAGNEVLRAIGHLLVAEGQSGGTLARVAGQRFMLLFPDDDARAATNAVERIRQTVELACFEFHDNELRLTVSCAVTETTPEDTSATLLARAEATLREAKRYGRNRTFLHEGKYPTPVVPPNFALEERRIEL
jgi:diguanylate cyclase